MVWPEVTSLSILARTKIERVFHPKPSCCFIIYSLTSAQLSIFVQTEIEFQVSRSLKLTCIRFLSGQKSKGSTNPEPHSRFMLHSLTSLVSCRFLSGQKSHVTCQQYQAILLDPPIAGQKLYPCFLWPNLWPCQSTFHFCSDKNRKSDHTGQ